jgi:hypothetical protein
MNDRTMTPTQIRRAGIEALSKALGPVGMARFLRQFEAGSGNYSEERHALLDHLRVEDVVSLIRQRRSTAVVSKDPPAD